MHMKPSKYILLKLSYVLILGMIMHGETSQIVLICLSFLTITVDIKFE